MFLIIPVNDDLFNLPGRFHLNNRELNFVHY